MRLAALNRASRADFVAALGAVFEHSPWVADAAWQAAPFTSVDALHAAMVAVVRASPAERQLSLIRAHPELAGKAARDGEMTDASIAEQTSGGLLSLDDAELTRIQRLNAAYRERFGFPFIIAVRRHDKASLLAAFEERLGHERDAEITTALGEIFVITRLRLDELIEG